MTRITFALLLLASVPLSAQPSGPSKASGEFLYVWAASADTTRKAAFLGVFDLREGSPTAGKVVKAVHAGPGTTGTHHTEHQLESDNLYFADDFGLGQTFIFDLKDPLDAKVHATFKTAGPFGWPHSYVRLPSGNRLVTYQWQSSKFNTPPGGLAEVKTDGSIVRWANATTAGVEDKDITPYSLEVLPHLDRVVSTSTSMIEDTGIGLQIWRLSDLSLLHTLRIPTGSPHGGHHSDSIPRHRLPGEPRILADGKTVMFVTFNCGLYVLAGVETNSPEVQPVHTFTGRDCSVPVVIGKYWIQPVPESRTVVVLDVSDPVNPKQVSSIDLGEGTKPHWLARDVSGTRIVVNNGTRNDSELYLLRFDPATGSITRDPSLPRLEMTNVNVPGVGIVNGAPHGAVFSR